MSWERALARLKVLRESRESRSIVDIWRTVLCKHQGQLGDELWNILEQVAIAGIDSHQEDVAEECIEKLEIRFPHSHRVDHLRGLQLEALSEYDEAGKHWNAIAESKELDGFARKRHAVILKEKGDSLGAIKELNSYLKTFPADFDAWLALSELYLSRLEYAKCAYCLEELILQQPYNFLYHCRLGEVRYTMGGYENVELARNYFLQATKLNASNQRAKCGLALAGVYLSTSGKLSATARADSLTLATKVVAQLQLSHAEAGTSTECAIVFKDSWDGIFAQAKSGSS